MHAVADVALPVAIVLLVATAAARAARRFLEPLTVACVFAAAVDAAAVLAGGDATVGSFVLPVAVGSVAILLGLTPVERGAPAAPPAPAERAAPESEPVHAPSPLWSSGDYRGAHRPAERRP
jgi:hypothetical protein